MICDALLPASCASPRETFDFSSQSARRLRKKKPGVAVAVSQAAADFESDRFVIPGENGDLNYLLDAEIKVGDSTTLARTPTKEDATPRMKSSR